MSDIRCGLYTSAGTAYPLRNVNVNVTVLQDFCCQVNLTQTFRISTQKKHKFNPSQCKGGHGLKEFETQRNSRPCFGCRKHISIGNLMFGCQDCDYHLCGDCHIPIRKNKKDCPENHGLKKTMAKANAIVCDVCDKNVPGGNPVYKCEECFYDLCESCYDPSAVAAPAKPKRFYATSYYFPLDGNAGVYDFKATLEDGTVVQGDCRPKNKAEKMYQAAIKQGKQAFLMKQEKSDIFQIQLGNVGEDEEVKIEISYVAELEMDGGKIRIRIPNRIAPKCGGGPQTSVTYPINFDFGIRTSSPILGIKALGGYDMEIINSPGDDNYKRVSIGREGYMNEDLVLLVEQKNPFGVYTALERSSQFNSDCLRLAFNKDAGNTTEMPGKADVIILVDKSGSMSGGRMKTTKKALSMFLRSLPVDSYFNIIAFDNCVTNAFPTSVKYNELNLQKAQKFCDKLQASGGTNIYTPLDKAILSKEHVGYSKSIILLTDGEVNDTDKCIRRVQNAGVRIFTLGIGSSFSQEIVAGLATATSATWEAVRDNKDIGSKVMRTLGCVLKPCINDFTCDMGPLNANNDLVMWPSKIPQIWDGRRTTIYWQRSSEKPLDLPAVFNVNLKGTYDNGDTLNMSLQVATADGEGVKEDLLKRSRLSCDGLVHRVAALSRIRKLERSKGNFNDQIRQLGMKYKLATSQTSFIAIRKGEPVNVKKEKPIPVIPQSFHNMGYRRSLKKSKSRSARPQASFGARRQSSGMISKGPSPAYAKFQSMPMSGSRSGPPAAPPMRSARRSIQSAPAHNFFESKSSSVKKSLSMKMEEPDLLADCCYDTIDCLDSQSESMAMPCVAMAAPPRRGLLDSVRQGKKLSKVSARTFQSQPEVESNNSIFSLLSRRSAICDNSDEDSSEEEWDDDDDCVQSSHKRYKEPKMKKEKQMEKAPAIKNPRAKDISIDWLIRQQGFIGNFSFDVNDYKFNEFKSFITTLAGKGITERDLLATILALVILQKQFGGQRDEWSLLEGKAKSWATKMLASKSVTLEEAFAYFD